VSFTFANSFEGGSPLVVSDRVLRGSPRATVGFGPKA